MSTRNELVTALAERYARSSKAERSVILDEFVAVSGSDAVGEALIVVWEASDRVCSKRLKPLVPVLLPALERHGRLAIGAEVRRLLLEISPASMDRLLSEVR
jgi:hypothetical protein